MSSSDLVVEIAKWSMGLEKTRVDTASRNIASANIPGSGVLQADFSSQIALVKNAVSAGADMQTLDGILSQPLNKLISENPNSHDVQLDTEVANLTSAELRYKTLAEALSRQLSLLTLAASGRQ